MIDNPCVISTTKMMLNNGKIQSCSVQCISKIYYCKNMSTDNHSHLTGIGKGKHYIPKTCIHIYIFNKETSDKVLYVSTDTSKKVTC